jgi:hypothetical protein
LCAFCVFLLMWLSQRKVLWMFIPRFLAWLTLFSTCPWIVVQFSLLWFVELRTCPGWIAFLYCIQILL